MIASAVNTLLGLWLVYAAVLDLRLLENGPWVLGISALALTALAIWACVSDYLKWPGITGIVIGVGLLIFAVSGAHTLSHSLTFWIAFWSGIVVGVLSLWSVFYRAQTPEAADATAGAGEHEPANY